MSCYRKQRVLRVPAERVGVMDRAAYDRFEAEHSGMLDYAVGHMACSLANSGERRYFDYWLYDRDMPRLCALDAYQWSRSLTSMERRKYAAAFRRLFPDINMDDVRYCEYVCTMASRRRSASDDAIAPRCPVELMLMEMLKRSVLNVYMSIPRELETDWISLMRQFGFLNAECQARGITMNLCKGWQEGFHWEELSGDGPSICVSLMGESDYAEGERAAAIDLLRREGVACVIALLKSESAGAAWYEVDRSAFYVLHYSEPSDIRIVELPAVQKLLQALAAGGEGDEDGRASEVHPGLILGRGPDLYETLQMNPDVIVALDSLFGDIWDEGFTGEILYYPIKPWGVLPFLILERLAVEVAARLEDQKRVALFSGEDCGRIGYVAACVLFQRGIREPVEWLRQNWEVSALSAELQEDSVRLFCYRHIARTYWHCVQLTRHIQIDSMDAFKADQILQRATSRIREGLGDKSRIAFRFSGLLPSVRILVEAADMAQCERAIDDMIRAITLTGHFVGVIQGW